jgi:hypothetical protein
MDFTPTNERKPTRADEDTDWLYRNPATKRTHRVEIDNVPDNARRIRTQHLDRDMSGVSEWVPIGRAKVPWDLADDYSQTVTMWDRAARHAPDAAKTDMTLLLLGTYIDESIAGLHYNGSTGILEIHRIDELAKLCGLPAETILGHEDTFSDGATYVPWPITERVLKALVARDPKPAAERLSKLRGDALHYGHQALTDGDL